MLLLINVHNEEVYVFVCIVHMKYIMDTSSNYVIFFLLGSKWSNFRLADESQSFFFSIDLNENLTDIFSLNIIMLSIASLNQSDMTLKI